MDFPEVHKRNVNIDIKASFMGAFYIARKVAFIPSKFALSNGIKTRLALWMVPRLKTTAKERK